MQAGRLNLARELFMLSCNPDVRNYVSVIRAYGQDGMCHRHSRCCGSWWIVARLTRLPTTPHSLSVVLAVIMHRRQHFDVKKSSGHVDVVSYNILQKQYIGTCTLQSKLRPCGMRCRKQASSQTSQPVTQCSVTSLPMETWCCLADE